MIGATTEVINKSIPGLIMANGDIDEEKFKEFKLKYEHELSKRPVSGKGEQMTTKQLILDALKRLAGSMKVWTTLIGLIAAITARYGFDVDQTAFLTIVGGFLALLGVQGANDWGAKGKQIAAAASMGVQGMTLSTLSSEAPHVTHVVTIGDLAVKMLMSDGSEHDVTAMLASAGYIKAVKADAPKTSEGGFATFSLLLFSSLIMGLGVLIVACASIKHEATVIKDAAISCASPSAKALTAEFGPTVDMLLARVTDSATGKIDWEPIKKAAKSSGKSELMCVVANVVASHLKKQANPSAPLVADLEFDTTSLRSGFAELAGGQLYEAEDGTILGAR